MRGLAVIVAGLIIASGCASERMKPTVHGIDNFGEVAPGIFRGGQPQSVEGWDYLVSIGATNVIKLNEDWEGSDNDPRFNVQRFSIPLSHQILFEPSEELVDHAVNSIGPNTFIHCTHGQDRTSLIVGDYRVWRCGWEPEQAREEMREYGFHPILFGLERYWEDHE